MQTHRDLAGSSLDQSDDRRVAVARRHEVDQSDPPVLGAEDRLQHHGALTVRATDMRRGISGVDAPPPVVRGAEQSREAGTAVEARPTQPVDGPVTANESGARAVSDQCIVFDGERQVGLRGCVGTALSAGTM